MKICRIVVLLLLLCVLSVGCDSAKPPEETLPDGDNSPEQFLTAPIGSAYDTSEMPTFSHAPGVYTDTLVLSLSCPSTSHTVRYTTDGSQPSLTSPAYTEPFLLSYDDAVGKSNADVTVFNLRAAAFDENGNTVGRIVSASYLFPKEADRFTTQVISLITEPSNLTGKDGILTNYANKGRDWERPVNFQLFAPDGTLSAAQDLGFRISGAGTRGFAQKSFRCHARKEYTIETGRLNGALFPGLLSEYTGAQIEEYNTFLIRSGASNFGNSMITNAIAFELMEGSAVDTANYEPAALFLNGDYYGLMMLMEDYDPYYFESHHGMEEDKITTVNFTVTDAGTLDWELDDCSEAEAAEWAAVRNYIITKDLTDPDHYARVCEMIDIENFIQYTVYECYLNNWDWPRNNQRVWRYNGAFGDSLTGAKGVGGYDPTAAEYGFDGRWRFVAKDMDLTHGLDVVPHTGPYAPYRTVETDFYGVMKKDRGANNQHYEMFRILILNEDFAKQYHLYVCQFMSGRANAAQYLAVINRITLQVADEMQYHLKNYNQSADTWDRHMETMRDFVKRRAAYVLDDLNLYIRQKKLSHPRITSAELKTFTGGTLLYCKEVIATARTIYAPLNTDLPITFVPDVGYILSDVQITGGTYDKQTGVLRITNASASITPIFVPDPEHKPGQPATALPVINEVGFSSVDRVNGSDWIELYNPSQAEINLTGYTVTNGISSYSLPNIRISAGGFKVLFCSGTADGGVYLPFSIASGETLSLLDPEGNVMDAVVLLTKGKNTHLGRYPDGGAWVELVHDEITPSLANAYRSEFSHHYSEKVQNTVIVEGVLLENSLFACNEAGELTIVKSNIAASEALPDFTKTRLLNFFRSYEDSERINLEQWYKKNPINARYHVYYVESLNSYIIHFN